MTLRPLHRRALLVGLVASLGACTRSSESVPACAPCRAGFAADARANAEIARTWQQLAVAPPGGAPSSRWPELALGCACFGTGPSAQVEGENLYLPSAWSREEQTARAAHLALHQARPAWSTDPSLDCDRRVALALDAEAEAHALELDVRRALAVGVARYPFEAEYFRRRPAERRGWLREYFMAHPAGDGVVPGFAALYAQRCSQAAPSEQGNEQNR